MHQALHIFKKDVGFLRHYIWLTLAAAGVFCWMGSSNVRGAGPTAFIVAVTWWFLIAAVIHAEPLPGRGHSWLTRPYRRKSLFCAKALFILTFVNIPALIADLVIIHAAGFSILSNLGGLLWTQVLLLVVFEIPAAAIASITSGLLELLIAMLFLIFIALAWYLVAPMTRLGFSWTGLEWVVQYYLFAQAAIASAIILFCQYAYRATFGTRIVAVLAPILLFASSALLPWTSAFQLQTHFSKRSVDTSSIQVRLDSERKWAGRIYLADNQEVNADLPIQLEGLPIGTEWKPFGVTMRLVAPDGKTLEVEASPPDSFEYNSGTMSLHLALAKTSYEKFRLKPLQLRGTIYFSLYKKSQSASISLDSRPRYIDGVGFCEASSRFLLCNSAFHRSPSSVELDLTQQSPQGFVRSSEQLSRLGSSSPFPADFNVDPVFQLFSLRLAPIFNAVVKSSEPIAYSQTSFNIDHLVLADFTFRN